MNNAYYGLGCIVASLCSHFLGPGGWIGPLIVGCVFLVGGVSKEIFYE